MYEHSKLMLHAPSYGSHDVGGKKPQDFLDKLLTAYLYSKYPYEEIMNDGNEYNPY